MFLTGTELRLQYQEIQKKNTINSSCLFHPYWQPFWASKQLRLWFCLFLLFPSIEILSGKSLRILDAHLSFSQIFFNMCKSCMVLLTCIDIIANSHILLSANLVWKQAGERQGMGFFSFLQCSSHSAPKSTGVKKKLFSMGRQIFLPQEALSQGGWTTQYGLHNLNLSDWNTQLRSQGKTESLTRTDINCHETPNLDVIIAIINCEILKM